ncbi:glycosyltransferase family 4 protein [Metabacillus halosaccharovorans]|uniref:Glycosyltransferase family 4 protein n=1 Tax=Metabacillus halosaccharovorans TaxID=930124 RepID=A0ABT3DE01_9BACI|nr:glycosyltransferase family 4 protein [Metabacillus halosaccharovorans]MCV9884751.1 glycosyltransferase family 4 protein [Metabacillus halosaccharovorans]
MRKICHITSVHRYDDTRIFIKECQSLTSEYETHLISPGAPSGIENNIHIHGIEKPANRIKRMTEVVNNVYKKALEVDAELYHFHDPELIFVGLRLMKKGKKVIYDVHEDIPRQILSKAWIAKPVRYSISKSFEVLENYAAKRFSAVIVATPHIKKRFLTLRSDVIDVNNFPLLKELSSPNHSQVKKNNSVCYVGVINKIRGIFEMVGAMEYTESELLLGGKFLSENDKSLVKEKEGWKKVNQLGQVSREEMARVLAVSSAGLVLFHPLPNHIDAQPNKMFEYMSAGVPVIASNFPLWKEIIEGNNCGICVDPMDPKEIGEAINRLVSNPEEVEKMGKNGRYAVETKYNWETESQKLLELYNRLLN